MVGDSVKVKDDRRVVVREVRWGQKTVVVEGGRDCGGWRDWCSWLVGWLAWWTNAGIFSAF